MSNAEHLHRHASRAYEDFSQLRRDRGNEALWHSLSHHLRHAVYRSGLAVGWRKRNYVRRRTQHQQQMGD